MKNNKRWWAFNFILGALVIAGCGSSTAPRQPSGAVATVTPNAQTTAITTSGGDPNPTATIPGSARAPLPAPWIAVPGLETAKGIAFSPSNPQVGYACGNGNTQSKGGDPFTIWVTHNGGASWQTVGTTPASIVGVRCILSISPSNTQYLALTASMFSLDAGTSDYPAYSFSLDGGASWQPLAMDTSKLSGPSLVPGPGIWVGSTLFQVYRPDLPNSDDWGQASHTLAASVNGGPLHWVDQGIATLDKSYPFVIGNTYNFLVNHGIGASGPPTVYSTSDSGAHWTTTTYAHDWQFMSNFYVSPDGKTLLSDTLALSTDTGRTWISEPTNGNYSLWYWASFAPDGTIVALFFDKSDMAIFTLAPRGSAWRRITASGYKDGTNSFIDGVNELVLTWDASGQPKSIWGLRVAQGNGADMGVYVDQL